PVRAHGARRAAVRVHDHHQHRGPRGRAALRPAGEGGLMATVAPEQPGVDLPEPRSWRRTRNRIATVAMAGSFVLVIVPLGFVLFTVISKGASVISWSFLTSPIPPSVLPAS